MPQLLLLGLEANGATAESEGESTLPDNGKTVLAGNPRHPVLRERYGVRARQAHSAEIPRLLAETQDIAYVALGHPLLDDAIGRELHGQARAAGWDVRLVPATSLTEQAYAGFAVGNAPLQVWSGGEFRNLNGETGLLVVAANVPPQALQRLARQVPGSHEVHVLSINEEQSDQVQTMPLAEAIARQADVLFVPPLSPLARLHEPRSLRWIMARLRAPDGCPWDREQTHQTLKRHLLEETAEVIDALDEDDMSALREELGDLLLQVYFQAQVAEEQGDFTFDDVVRGISEKLVRRHPHVFGDRAAGSAEQALANWESIKQEEHAEQGKERHSLLDRIPRALSGLTTAQAIGKSVAKVGFDWPHMDGVLAKLREEMDELDAAETTEHRFEELGDVLFVMAQVAKWLDVDAEEALRAANAKFRRRFAYMEEVARGAGEDLSEYSFDKLDSLWEEAKLATSNPWGCPR